MPKTPEQRIAQLEEQADDTKTMFLKVADALDRQIRFNNDVIEFLKKRTVTSEDLEKIMH